MKTKEICDVQEALSMPTEALSNPKFQALFRKLTQCIKDIDAQLLRLGSPIEFFETKNLATVARWASLAPNCGGKYRAFESALVWEEPTNDAKVSLPENYNVPVVRTLEILQLAISQS